ncbi:hypothetical protein KCP75_15395 [Salmonella enterica subsp. enterica]|nr:hypothetical protein KCP75_15395 [Salmonella enterica subsp. enterica]
MCSRASGINRRPLFRWEAGACSRASGDKPTWTYSAGGSNTRSRASGINGVFRAPRLRARCVPRASGDKTEKLFLWLCCWRVPAPAGIKPQLEQRDSGQLVVFPAPAGINRVGVEFRDQYQVSPRQRG